MRDQYGRITPDFEAWKKLGWVYTECHENTYTLTNKADLDNPWEFEQIYFDFEEDDDSPSIIKERISLDSNRNAILPLTDEEAIQAKRDLDDYYAKTGRVPKKNFKKF